MMFEVYVSGKAKKFFRNLDRKIADELISAVSFLKTSPVPVKEFDIKKLAGETDSYRIRMGRYRILYTVYWDEKIIRISKIEMKGETTYK